MKDDKKHADILLVEDSPSLTAVYQGYLACDEFHVLTASTGGEALKKLEQYTPDVVLLDLKLPDISGMDVLRQIHEAEQECSVVIITAHGSADVAIEAMRYGAVDFISKPFNAPRLKVTLENVLENRHLAKIVNEFKKTFVRDRFHSFIGSSMPMQAVFRIIENAAPSKATVFITGESGTGKELCAEAIHSESQRQKHAFVAINCAAIPKDLMESEIFGHVKGAFTGAVGKRDGAAIRADGGTLFLDEICEMDLDLQSKLLRFIQTGTFQRVGDTKLESVDVRFVCATNRDPLEQVRAGKFREDLYYRLNVIPINLPPLCEREGDVMLIAKEMLRRITKEEGKKFKGYSTAVIELFQDYRWPGNVRELENTIRNIVVLNNNEQVSYDMLPHHLSRQDETPDNRIENKKQVSEEVVSEQTAEVSTPLAINDIRPLWVEEKEIIERAISICDGNVPKAAALLDISASTIYRKRQSWDNI